MITGVRIAGTQVDPGTVVTEAITVTHGRSTVGEAPSASSASLILLTPVMPPWSVGDPIVIESAWGPLFTGEISDRTIPEHIKTVEHGMCARVELDCTGAVALLGRRPVGDEPWPQEAATARAERILTLAGVPHTVDVSAEVDVMVSPQDIDRRTALDVLDDLAADTAAAVVDMPDGTVLYQPLQARSRPVFYTRWQDFPPEDLWSDFDAAMTWADFDVISPAAEQPLVLPPDAVAFEPEWQSTAGAIINSVRLGYGVPPEGEEQPDVALQDGPSIARYGQRHYGAQTQLARLEDASAVASWVMSARAWERWTLGSVDVYADVLDDQQRAAVAALRCGDWVQVDGLPQPAPATSWAGICEGWAYREWVTGETRRAAWTLSLSDPLLSLAVPTWADHTPAHEWQDYSPLVTWADMTSLESIGA